MEKILHNKKGYINPVCDILVVKSAFSVLDASGGFEKPIDDGELEWE